MHNIPFSLRDEVERDLKPYTVAFHYKLDPDEVRSWDNDTILKALYALKKMGVLK